MNPERQDELAPLYALDLLEGAEKAEFEAFLAANPAAQAEIRQLRETVSALAYAAPATEPPAALKGRILAATSRGPQGREAAAPARVIAFPTLIAWAAAACFALAAAWTTHLYVNARSEHLRERDRLQLADLELQSARNRLEAERIVNSRELADARRDLTHTRRELADATQRIADSDQRIAVLDRKLAAQGDLDQLKIATLASLLGNTPDALAVAVWDPTGQKGVLSVSKLPAVASNKDYQLWVIDPTYPAPVSGGIFTVDPATGEARVNFKAGKPIKSGGAKFAVSLERKGGAPAPQGKIVLISQ